MIFVDANIHARFSRVLLEHISCRWSKAEDMRLQILIEESIAILQPIDCFLDSPHLIWVNTRCSLWWYNVHFFSFKRCATECIWEVPVGHIPFRCATCGQHQSYCSKCRSRWICVTMFILVFAIKDQSCFPTVENIFPINDLEFPSKYPVW